MSKEKTLRIEAMNIGIHNNLKFNHTFKNICIGVFASNGTGKTALSRMIRLADKFCPNYEIARTDKLISLGKTDGTFRFGLSPEGPVENLLEITLKTNSIAQVKNNSPFIFHVFNSDYIKENLASNRYVFDDKIDGYILGKESIDITDYEKHKKILFGKFEKLKAKIDDAIKDALKVLDEVPIRRNTNEYQNITYINLYNEKEIVETESYKNLLSRYKIAITMPDDIQEVPLVKPIDNYNNFFAEITTCLSESYSKGRIAEEFKSKVLYKQEFIETGLKLLDEDRLHCPFCEQEMQMVSLKLIDDYNEYLADEETKIKNRIQSFQKTTKYITKSIEDSYNSYLISLKKYNEVKKYIPSLMDSELPSISDLKLINTIILELSKVIEEKEHNISLPLEKHTEIINSIKIFISTISEQVIKINKSINVLNEKKTRMDAEKLNMRKRLCNAMFARVTKEQIDNLNDIKMLEKEITMIEGQIREAISKFKANKKDKVAESLKNYLFLFFGDKYEFDDKNFCIRFQASLLKNEPDEILSDGEKSILAFCHYLASTHKAVNIESDYDRLFFVIDDPVSSMDFHFVYAVAQVIRKLDNSFSEKKVPILIFTHSLEFMSILIRNKVIGQKYILTAGTIKKIGNELIMPYEEHLRDIFNIALEKETPSHTTPNSMRHVLETLWRFERPDIDNFGKYINELGVKEFEDNAYLYSLIQDSSHGVMRSEASYNSETIINACKLVVNFVEKKYCGQINLIK